MEHCARFQRKIEVLNEVFAFTERCFREFEVGGANANAIDVAIEEIFTNFVRHNRTKSDGIFLSLKLSEGTVEIRLDDHDVDRFDITEVPDIDTDATLDERQPGGLGLHITRRLMDKIEYRYNDRTSSIIMTKCLEK